MGCRGDWHTSGLIRLNELVPPVPQHIHRAGTTHHRLLVTPRALLQRYMAVTSHALAPPQKVLREGWPPEGNSGPAAGLCTSVSCAARFRFLVAPEASQTLAAAKRRTGTENPSKPLRSQPGRGRVKSPRFACLRTTGGAFFVHLQNPRFRVRPTMAAPQHLPFTNGGHWCVCCG